MKKSILLKSALAISGAGLLFSGYLSYIELGGKGASCSAVQNIIRLPTCIYGFVMYALIFALLAAVILKRGDD